MAHSKANGEGGVREEDQRRANEFERLGAISQWVLTWGDLCKSLAYHEHADDHIDRQ